MSGARPHLMTVTAACGFVTTAVVVVFPAVRFAYRSPEFHIALETAAACAALLAALLFFGRLREDRLRSSWALVYALLVSALVNFGFSVVPLVIDARALATFSQWTTAFGRLVAAGAFAYAAFSRSPLRPDRRLAATVVLAALATTGALTLLVSLATPVLPPGIGPGPQDAAAAVEPHALLMATQLIGLGLFTAASVGFVHRSARTGDELMRWLSAGALLASFARLHYVLYPSAYTQWVYTGDILRLGFYGLLLVGAVSEIRRYWQRMAEGLAEEERRRVARDLHDGLAQELAFISAQARWLEHEATEGTIQSVIGAASRALDESRRAIAALTRPVDEPLEVALAQAAEEVADRVGTTVSLDLEAGIEVAADAREDLIRIAREAIANAGRHSQAEQVQVRLYLNGQRRLVIHDDGVGFRLDQTRPDRFGLVSMRERARALGADIQIRTSPGQGTTVEVALP